DLYALGLNLIRLLDFYDESRKSALTPYIRKYLRLMACRLLDGLNSNDHCALGLPRGAFSEFRYLSAANAVHDLRKLTGEYSLSAAIPELNYHAEHTIQTSSL